MVGKKIIFNYRYGIDIWKENVPYKEGMNM